MKKILILIMVFMAVATVYGREITGKVVGENDTPLDYVNVVLYRDSTNGTSQPLSQSIEEKIVEFCKEPRSGAEIAAYCGFKDVKNFRERRPLQLVTQISQISIGSTHLIVKIS